MKLNKFATKSPIGCIAISVFIRERWAVSFVRVMCPNLSRSFVRRTRKHLRKMGVVRTANPYKVLDSFKKFVPPTK